ncbi:MOSC domain-containing protein [Knoellia sp. CPCC 206453]|uniref:MOSC domain-containing protein n=1 Tax=Knoellia pratensis TaxID=3404796 RepID=UPI00360A13D9
MTRLRVERLGLALIKGTRHTGRDEIELDHHGPVGDRSYCLVDRAEARVLRTVENPALVQLVAADLGDRLAVTTPDGQTTEAATEGAADGIHVADYWGRGARIVLQDSALSAVFSAHLGREVTLARAERGDVVYADPISIITTGALRRLSEALKTSGYAGPRRAWDPPPALDVRFRATVTVVSDEDPAPGTRLQLGEAVIEIGEPLERCAVIDLDPITGERNSRLLEHVRADDGRLLFGFGARVVTPGRVALG